MAALAYPVSDDEAEAYFAKAEAFIKTNGLTEKVYVGMTMEDYFPVVFFAQTKESIVELKTILEPHFVLVMRVAEPPPTVINQPRRLRPV